MVFSGPVAHLARALVWHTKGSGFESRQVQNEKGDSFEGASFERKMFYYNKVLTKR